MFFEIDSSFISVTLLVIHIVCPHGKGSKIQTFHVCHHFPAHGGFRLICRDGDIGPLVLNTTDQYFAPLTLLKQRYMKI